VSGGLQEVGRRIVERQDRIDLLFLLPVVQVSEGDDAAGDAPDAVVGDGDAVDVAPQIAQA
jgi:hypothetical protein